MLWSTILFLSISLAQETQNPSLIKTAWIDPMTGEPLIAQVVEIRPASAAMILKEGGVLQDLEIRIVSNPQEPEKIERRWFIVEAQLGAPQIVSASFGILIGGYAHTPRGFLFAIEPGLSATRITAGIIGKHLETFGFFPISMGLRASFVRTYFTPIFMEKNENYLGPEIDFRIGDAWRFSFGVLKQLSDDPKKRGWHLNAGVGFNWRYREDTFFLIKQLLGALFLRNTPKAFLETDKNSLLDPLKQ